MAKRGFELLSKKERVKIAASGGAAAHAKGTAYVWNRQAAQRASLKRLGLKEPPFKTRKVVDVAGKVHYEYLVPNGDGEFHWMSRQRVYLLRKKGKL